MGALAGKSVVVTGASRGLGEEMAAGYAAEGALLTLAARSEDDLERVAARCREAGATAVAVPTDITDEASVENLVKQALATHGRIDVFVANAGIANAGVRSDKRYREIDTYDLDVVEGIFRVNVFGTFLCMKHALPEMTGGGSFISIGSETGRALYPGAGMYAISKATIDAMSTLASREVAARGIRVNVLSPGGMVDTKLFGPTGMPAFLKEAIPPLPGDAIVPAAIWLAGDDSKEITGAFVSGKDFNARGAAAIAAEHAAAVAEHDAKRNS